MTATETSLPLTAIETPGWTEPGETSAILVGKKARATAARSLSLETDAAAAARAAASAAVCQWVRTFVALA